MNVARSGSALLLALAGATAHANVFKCVEPGGAVRYQQTPCPESAKQTDMEQGPAGSAASSRVEQEQALEVLLALGMKGQCDRHVPGFRERHANTWDRWRMPRLATIAKVEQTPEYKQMVAGAKAPDPRDLARLKDDCDNLMDGLANPPAGQASPQAAWKVWMDGLAAADRTKAASVLVGTARQKYRKLLAEASDDVMRKMAGSIRALVPGTGFGEYQEFFAVRHDGQGGAVYFVRHGGKWLISEM